MLIEYEIIKPDPGSSLKCLNQHVSPDEYVWQYHYHPEIELTCVLEGHGVCHVGQHMSRYENGILVLIGSNLPHSGFGLHSSDPHDEIVVQADYKKLNIMMQHFVELRAVKKLMERSKYGVSFHGNTFEDVLERLQRMVEAPPEDRMLYFMKILSVLAQSEEYTMLNERVITSKKYKHVKNRLEKVFTYIEKNYSGTIEIHKIASDVNMTIPSFSSFFKRMTSRTFTDFVNSYRVQKACLLLNEGFTITDTCFMTGFNSVSYFSKVFRSYMSQSPRDYVRYISPLK